MQQKLGTRFSYDTHKISQNFIFVFVEHLHFQQTSLSFLLSKFASQIKLILSVVGVSC